MQVTLAAPPRSHAPPAHNYRTQALRLCPCAAPQPYFRGLHDAVADVVTRQLENGDANVFISRQYDTSKGHTAICTGASCPSTDAMKTFDLTKLGLPSNAELLKSIRFNIGLRCDPR